MWSGPCPTPSTWHHLDLQDLPLKTNALLPAIVLRMDLDFFGFSKKSHIKTLACHTISSAMNFEWKWLPRQNSVPPLRPWKHPVFVLDLKRIEYILKKVIMTSTSTKGTKMLRQCAGNIAELSLKNLSWWQYIGGDDDVDQWKFIKNADEDSNCEDIVWPAVLIHSRPSWVHLCRGVHRPRATAALWHQARTSNTLGLKAFVGW